MKAKTFVGAATALACIGTATGVAYGIKGRSSQLFGRSIYRGAGRRRSIALTFDDGPSEGTLELLDLLAAEDIRATFFQCGMNAERYPRIARLVAEAGHEIGNHTYSHPRLCPRLGLRPNLRSPAEIYEELATTQKVLTETTGRTPVLFRPPYGFRWFGLGAAQRRLNLLGVLWTVIGHDWEWGSREIARHVMSNTEPAGIICLHDGRDIRRRVDLTELILALKLIIPALKANGYAFETVSDLRLPDPSL